jgi:hypothetical protein
MFTLCSGVTLIEGFKRNSSTDLAVINDSYGCSPGTRSLVG